MRRFSGMRPKYAEEARARAEAMFNRRQRQKPDAADTPAATTEYGAAQQAALKRMLELRRLRLARERKD